MRDGKGRERVEGKGGEKLDPKNNPGHGFGNDD